jgi:hypothetical protein
MHSIRPTRVASLIVALTLTALIGVLAFPSQMAAGPTSPDSPGVYNWRVVTVDSGLSTGKATSLALDASGRPRIAYDALPASGIGALRYAWSDGGSWQFETVDPGGELGFVPSLALDNSGNPHISYNGIMCILDYAYKDASGWHTEEVDSAGWVCSTSSLALDSAGHPGIAYYVHYPFFDLKYAYRDTGGWHNENVDTGGDVGSFLSLDMTTAGPSIAYYDATNTALKYAWKDAAGWHTEIADNDGDVGEYASLTMASGNPHVSYYDATAKALKHAQRNSQGVWQTETVDRGADGALAGVGKYTSIAWGETGVHIAYYDEANQRLKYAQRPFFSTYWNLVLVDAATPAGIGTSVALDQNGQPAISYRAETNGRAVRYAWLWSTPGEVAPGWLDPLPGQEEGAFTVQVAQDPDADYLGHYAGPIAFDMPVGGLCVSPPEMARLDVRAFDVDSPGEVDTVALNGHVLGALQGASGAWSTTSFQVPKALLNYPDPPNGTAHNAISVSVDDNLGAWMTEIAWARLWVPGAGANACLAKRFAPYMFFHPQELYRPMAVEPVLNTSTLVQGSWATMWIRRLLPPAIADLLDPVWNRMDTYLDHPGNGADEVHNAYLSLGLDRLAPLVYARVVRSTPERTVVQYRFHYYDNPFWNHHEGDWEMVAVVLDAADNPLYAAYSQHDWGSRRMWGYVDKVLDHPCVYVAKGSHASYFRPYTYRTPFLTVDETHGAYSQPIAAGVFPIQMLPEAGSPNNWLDFKGHWGGPALPDLLPWDEDGPGTPGTDDPLGWAESQDWDEDARQNDEINARAQANITGDVRIADSIWQDRTGWFNGYLETGIPRSEYFENCESLKRTIILHEVNLFSVQRFVAEVTSRSSPCPAAALAADAVKQVSLTFPDVKAGTSTVVTYTLPTSWGLSSDGKVTLESGCDFQMAVDLDGNGSVDLNLPPSEKTNMPLDLVPPAAVVDLAATGARCGQVDLTWSAPGDDGATGTAFRYDVRYAASPITDDNWVSAMQVTGLPAPEPVGSAESFTARGVPAGAHYFAIRALDDAMQESPISNLTSITSPECYLDLPMLLRR